MGKDKKEYILTSKDIILLFLFLLVIITIIFTIGVTVGKNMVISKLEKEKKIKGIVSETAEIPSQNLVTPIEVEKSDVKESDIVEKVTTPKVEKVSTPKVEKKKETPRPQKANKITRNKLKSKPKKLYKPIKKYRNYDISRTLYIVQVMATKSLNEAKRYKSKLRKMGFDVYIRPPATKGDYYRVQLGSFRNRKNALNLLKKLKKHGVDGFVRKRKVY